MAQMADPDPSRPARSRGAALVALVFVLGAGVALPAPVRAQDTVTLVARVGGRAIAEADERRPLRLEPDRPLPLELTLTNRGSAPVQVRTVRLVGKVIGLKFFGYETTVSIGVPAGATVTREFALELGGLAGQATGLIPSSISVLDEDREELGSQRLVVDVRGSLRSVYGLFGVAVAVLTAVNLGGAFIALARHRLPTDRWRRALRFLPGGIGLGLTAVFLLSALRVFAPQANRWVPILLLTSAVAFGLGYLTPTPERDPEAGSAERAGRSSTTPDDGRTTRRSPTQSR